MSARTRGVVACALLLTVAACSADTNAVDASDLSPADAGVCRDLVDALPETLAGHDQVEVTGDTAYGAAWGDPPILLTCGVDAVDLTNVPPCTVVNGVGWIVQESDGATILTADGYRPRVQVRVPDDYDQPASTVTGLASLLKGRLQLEDRCL